MKASRFLVVMLLAAPMITFSLAVNCDCRGPVNPAKYPASVAVTPMVPALPAPSDAISELTGRSVVAMELAPPLTVGCLESSCRWISDETPDRNPSIAAGTAECVILPFESVTTALLACRLDVTIPLAAPVTVGDFASSCAWMLDRAPPRYDACTSVTDARLDTLPAASVTISDVGGRSAAAIVEAAPLMDGALASSCVWMPEETPWR